LQLAMEREILSHGIHEPIEVRDRESPQ
jgi:hypothetical protein